MVPGKNFLRPGKVLEYFNVMYIEIIYWMIFQVVRGRVLADGTSLDYRMNGNLMNIYWHLNLHVCSILKQNINPMTW